MTSTDLKHTLTVWAIVVVAALAAWFMFKIVVHVVAAVLTGVFILGVALFVYFKFFRKTRAS